MDHLPYPNLGVPPIVVPYLSGFEYDGEDFATFPERVGFWKDGTLDLDRPCRQLAALAQAWLFFGLIDVFTRQRVDKGVLIRREDNNGVDEVVVDTTALGGIVKESVKRRRMPLSKSKVLRGIRMQLMEAGKASSALDRIQVDDSSSSAVFLSIKILIVYLSEVFKIAFWVHYTIHPFHSFPSPILERGRQSGCIPAPARLLMDRMSRSGWCIHQIMEICNSHNYRTVYYYSSITRAESWDEITHEACTEAQCVAYNIKDDSDDKIRHTEECSGCEPVGPPEEEVASIIRNGDIPLVELDNASLENQTQLEVKPATPYSRYTAISHVWIDGHGNPTANTLPKCQLQKLAARLSAIPRARKSRVGRLWNRRRDPAPTSHLLWMDTLCIPPQRGSEDQTSVRKKAIHRMALIYVGAEQVLVLDAELDKYAAENIPCELKDALISCSRWNGRCWTLEEGALARKCLFQFKDAARAAAQCRTPQQGTLSVFFRFDVDGWRVRVGNNIMEPDEISPDFARDYLHFELAVAAQRSAQTDIGHASHNIGRRTPDRELEMDKFVRTWNDIGRRSTTRPNDIHPIIANLTDFSAAQIMELETPVLRTKMIAHCIGEFPLDLLWTPCARPQSNEDSADRWVPSIPGPEPLIERVKLRLTDKGLVVDTKHIWQRPQTFYIPRGMVAPRFCFHWRRGIQEELWYVVECIIAEDDALPRSASETACLILSHNAGATAALQVLRGARLLGTNGGSKTSQSLYLRYDCPLTCRIQRHRPDIEQIHDTPIMTVDKVSQSREIVIESTFDPKDRKKFNMRSRNFYYGRSGPFLMNYTLFSIAISFCLVLIPATTCVALISLFFADISNYLTILSMVASFFAFFCLFLFVFPFIWRWQHARAYKAWKVTFEENWVPNDSFIKRSIKAVRQHRGRRRGKEKEQVNV